MTDEEKKAIEYIKKCLDDEYDFKNATRQKDKKVHNIILNLIEKQSKEIEELKENNKNLEDELNKYIVKLSDEQYRRLVDIIRDEINKLWKDKIKAEIEESELLIDNSQGCMSDEDLYKEYGKIEFGQSLLEKG